MRARRAHGPVARRGRSRVPGRVAGRGLVAILLTHSVALGAPRVACAGGWGGITPGETTRREVEALYGKPGRERNVVQEGRTVSEWTYLSDRSPTGVSRVVVAFGLIKDGQFLPDLVRAVTLYPDPGAFTVAALRNGWGDPVARGVDDSSGRTLLRYAEGLVVALDQTGRFAEVMMFAPLPRR